MRYALTLDFSPDLFDRHKWKQGKWTTEHDVYLWVDPDTDYDCLIIRHRLGYLSGYVGIPQHHPLYGSSDSNEQVAALKIHGNLLISGSEIIERNEDYLFSIPVVLKDREQPLWGLGFGCHHDLDLIPYLFHLSGTINEGESYKDVPYLTKEVTALARQLKALENLELGSSRRAFASPRQRSQHQRL